MAPFRVRPAKRTDAGAVVPLLYASADAMYDRFAGGAKLAATVIGRAFQQDGTNASAEVVTVAEIEGRVAAAVSAFPVEETSPRSRAFLSLTLRTLPPWRWPAALRLYWAGARAAPTPPSSALYVDALATHPRMRRRGAARALLEQAEGQARARGLPAVALDTALDNRAARSLYLGAGYEEVAYKAPDRGLPGFVALVKEFA